MCIPFEVTLDMHAEKLDTFDMLQYQVVDGDVLGKGRVSPEAQVSYGALSWVEIHVVSFRPHRQIVYSCLKKVEGSLFYGNRDKLIDLSLRQTCQYNGT